MNKMNPTFELYLEKGGGEKIQILCAQKKKFTINNYYMIQLENDKNISRNSVKCLGKLRAINNEKDKYVLYDNGDAWDSKELEPNHQNLRKEHGAFVYRYEMCNVGNIRKMKIMFPQLNCYQVREQGAGERAQQPKIKKEFTAEDKFKFTVDEYGPTKESETFMKLYEQNVLR